MLRQRHISICGSLQLSREVLPSLLVRGRPSASADIFPLDARVHKKTGRRCPSAAPCLFYDIFLISLSYTSFLAFGDRNGLLGSCILGKADFILSFKLGI